MKSIIEIDGHNAIVSFEPDMNLFRGKFLGLNCRADFYAADLSVLRVEGRISLNVVNDLCREKEVEPKCSFSGKFNVRLAAEPHEAAVVAAATERKSLNEWVTEAIANAANSCSSFLPIAEPL